MYIGGDYIGEFGRGVFRVLGLFKSVEGEL